MTHLLVYCLSLSLGTELHKVLQLYPHCREQFWAHCMCSTNMCRVKKYPLCAWNILSHPLRWAVTSILRICKLRLRAEPGIRVSRLPPDFSINFTSVCWNPGCQGALPTWPEPTPAGLGRSCSLSQACLGPALLCLGLPEANVTCQLPTKVHC